MSCCCCCAWGSDCCCGCCYCGGGRCRRRRMRPAPSGACCCGASARSPGTWRSCGGRSATCVSSSRRLSRHPNRTCPLLQIRGFRCIYKCKYVKISNIYKICMKLSHLSLSELVRRGRCAGTQYCRAFLRLTRSGAKKS